MFHSNYLSYFKILVCKILLAQISSQLDKQNSHNGTKLVIYRPVCKIHTLQVAESKKKFWPNLVKTYYW